MNLQGLETHFLDNLPTWVALIYLAYLFRKLRNDKETAEVSALTGQVRVLSAAHEALLVTNTTMSKRFDEMEALRAKERKERDVERAAEDKARCDADARIDLFQKSIEHLTDMTHKQQNEIDMLQEEVKRRDTRIADLEKKLDEREDRITELERKSSDLKGEREMLLAKVADLTEKVEELQKRGTGPLAEPGEQKSADVAARDAKEESN